MAGSAMAKCRGRGWILDALGRLHRICQGKSLLRRGDWSLTTIEAFHLGKRYKRSEANKARTLQEAIFSGFRGFGSKEYVRSLRQVSFQVERGSILGVIGRNGAGKSTLLRIAGGIIVPDEGEISIRGSV